MGVLNSPQAGVAAQATPGILSGIGGLMQGNYGAAVAQNNAALSRQNAASAVEAGQYNASQALAHGSTVQAQQEASQGANGLDVGVGSAVATRQATGRISAMDAAMIQYNAARTAYGFQTQANTEDTQAKLDKMAGRNALLTGISKAGGAAIAGEAAFPSSYVNKGKTVADKWSAGALENAKYFGAPI
jgi:hypothetical protein